MARTPPVGVPLPLPPGDQTGPTRIVRRKPDTLELEVALGWKPTVERLALIASALISLALGFETIAATVFGIVGGNIFPLGVAGRKHRR